MEKTKKLSAWTEEGYNLFAQEGLEGIQIERLARIVHLNKSGFYHYFGDLEVFYSELLRMHEKKTMLYLDDARKITSIDPGYFEMVVKHKMPVMFHMQLWRMQDRPEFYSLAARVDEEEDRVLRGLWSEYLGFDDNPEVAIKYFAIVRDMAYTRMSFQNLTVEFLQTLFTDAKMLVRQIACSTMAMETDDSLR